MIVQAKLKKNGSADIDVQVEGTFPSPSAVHVWVNSKYWGIWGGGDLYDALLALVNIHPGYRLGYVA